MRMASLYPDQKLKRRAMAWAQRIKVNPEQIVIVNMPDKWGSCTPDGVVTFADDLAETDESFQDFVIVHELLHLRYKTHGKRFQVMLTALVPDWRVLEHQSQHRIARSARQRKKRA